jgi:hypothetical protein
MINWRIMMHTIRYITCTGYFHVVQKTTHGFKNSAYGIPFMFGAVECVCKTQPRAAISVASQIPMQPSVHRMAVV